MADDSAPELTHSGARGRVRAGRHSALRQAVTLQQLIFKDATSENCRPLDRVKFAQAWNLLEERKRILKMRPNPAGVRPELYKPKRRNSSGGIETAQTVQIVPTPHPA